MIKLSACCGAVVAALVWPTPIPVPSPPSAARPSAAPLARSAEAGSARLLPVRPPPARPEPLRTWTVAGVGDVLLHSPLQRQAASHGFGSLWPDIEPYFQQATVAYANLEGPTASGLTRGGGATADPGPVFDNRVYTSYPLFNYPPALLAALQSSGIDVVSTANNHALDRGADGVRRTIAALDAQKLAFTGTREGPDANRPWYVLTNTAGLTVGWIACSFSTNGVPDRQGQVLNCYRDRATLLETVRALAAVPSVGAVIATPHWGVEYTPAPQPQEKALARELIDVGATAVLGAHPHVPQPWEVHRAPDGRAGLIAYSLGNFVSGQFHRVPTRAAVLAQLQLVGRPGERARLVEARAIHLEMARTPDGYRVRPLPFPGHTQAIAAHLERMFGPNGQAVPVNPQR